MSWILSILGNPRQAGTRCPVFVFPLVVCLSALDTGCHQSAFQKDRQSAEQDWDRLRGEFKLRIAMEQIERGHVHEAMASLRKVIALDPKNPAVYRLLARCQLEMSSLSAVTKSLNQAERLGDASAELHYMKGMLAERESRFKEALQHYRLAAEQEADHIDYLLAVAESLMHLGRVVDANALLDEHIQTGNADAQLTLLRAQTHLLLDKPEAAAADFEAAEDLLSGAAWAAEDYGLLLVRLGRLFQAVAVLRPIVESGQQSLQTESGPRHPSGAAVRGLATCYLRLGAPGKARKLLVDHLTRAEDDGRAWWLLAETMIQLEGWDDARDSIRQGRVATPQIPKWDLLEACVAWRQGDLEKTALLLEAVVIHKPQNDAAQWFLAQVQRERGSLDDADTSSTTQSP